jgi:pimeloyl-ACP methyl ester carboxylesterase
MFNAVSVRADPLVIEQSNAGRGLLANFAVPDGQTKHDPVILMVHGTFGHKDMEIMKALQSALMERGVANLAVTLSLGADKREGPRNCRLPIRDTYGDGRKEIGVWFNWLRNKGYENIVLLGHSRGGARVAEFLSFNGEDSGVKKAVLLAPATEEPGRFLREYDGRLSTQETEALIAKFQAAKDDAVFEVPSFLYCRNARASAAAFRAYYGPDQERDTPTLLTGTTHIPVLVIAAGEDAVIKDLPGKMKLLEAAQNISFTTVDGAGHLFLDFYAEDAAELIANFVKGNE